MVLPLVRDSGVNSESGGAIFLFGEVKVEALMGEEKTTQERERKITLLLMKVKLRLHVCEELHVEPWPRRSSCEPLGK